MTTDRGFYEEDEPIEDVVAAFNRGIPVVTASPETFAAQSTTTMWVDQHGTARTTSVFMPPSVTIRDWYDKMNADDPIAIESIKRLVVHPGETLVVRVAQHISKEFADELNAMFKQRIPEGVNVLVTTPDIELEVVAKPRQLPLRRTAYTGEQWTELTQWLKAFGTPPSVTISITLTDHDVTVTAYKLDSKGRRYLVSEGAEGLDHRAATMHYTVPLSGAPAWFSDLAG